MSGSDLTIVLTLRGRHLHTLRWLWHANRVRLPFHVIIADGEVHPSVGRLMSSSDVFSDLSFEYRRYDDRSFSDFFKKVADTLSKVQTKYVMVSDNDDFLFVSGLERSVDFLERSPDYVCAGGNVYGFEVSARPEMPGAVIGTLARIPPSIPGTPYPSIDIADPSASTRVLDEIRHYQSIYYHVSRTAALQTVTAEIAEHDFTDLEVHEYYGALRTITFGKARTDDAQMSYLRQLGTSSRFGSRGEWFRHLFRSRLPQDYSALAEAVARAASAADGSSPSDAEALKERILDGLADRLGATLADAMKRRNFPRLFAVREKLAHLRPDPRAMFPHARLQRDQRKLWERLQVNGASAALVTAHAAELKDMEVTLGGGPFLEFVRSNAPDLLPS